MFVIITRAIQKTVKVLRSCLKSRGKYGYADIFAKTTLGKNLHVDNGSRVVRMLKQCTLHNHQNFLVVLCNKQQKVGYLGSNKHESIELCSP